MSDNIGVNDDPGSPTQSITSEDLKPSKDTEDENSELIFDLSLVLAGFKKCKRDDEQIYLDDYLRGYVELNKIFQLMGSVFNFVSSDVQKKVTILECYRKGGAGDFYYSIQSMIEYEKEHEIVNGSGSRNLLRLHRGLDFIIGFLEELENANPDTKLGNVTTEVYNRTLARHHGWILAKTVCAVLYWMPTKQEIIDKVTRGDEELYARNKAVYPEVIEVMKSVYNATQKLYEDYDILDLP